MRRTSSPVIPVLVDRPLHGHIARLVLTCAPCTPSTRYVSVGDEAVNAEDHKALCVEAEPAYMRSKTEYAQKERERERERDKEYVYIHTNATVTMKTNLTKGYKVTLYSD